MIKVVHQIMLMEVQDTKTILKGLKPMIQIILIEWDFLVCVCVFWLFGHCMHTTPHI